MQVMRVTVTWGSCRQELQAGIDAIQSGNADVAYLRGVLGRSYSMYERLIQRWSKCWPDQP